MKKVLQQARPEKTVCMGCLQHKELCPSKKNTNVLPCPELQPCSDKKAMQPGHQTLSFFIVSRQNKNQTILKPEAPGAKCSYHGFMTVRASPCFVKILENRQSFAASINNMASGSLAF